jgi:hypothetical protein
VGEAALEGKLYVFCSAVKQKTQLGQRLCVGEREYRLLFLGDLPRCISSQQDLQRA